MPRSARIAPGGMVFHVLNRANARGDLFDGQLADFLDERDAALVSYEAAAERFGVFGDVVAEALEDGQPDRVGR